MCQREIHMEILKPSEEDGLDLAKDNNGNGHISEKAMCHCWPNWIVKMVTRFKDVCVCGGYGVPSEVHEYLNIVQRRILKKTKEWY